MGPMSQEPFGDIPLFRELQRLLSSGGGPINRELARQIAGALAADARPDPEPGVEFARRMSEMVHSSESVLSGFTRLPLEEPLQGRGVTRSWWVTETLDAWRWLLEHLAMRLSNQLGRLGPEVSAEAEESSPMHAMMTQIGPLLMGMQTGTLIGHLAREQIGRYDLPIPRDDDGRLFVVVGNTQRLAADFSLSPEDVEHWVVLQDAARALIVKGTSWVNSYFRSLLHELVDSLEIDAGALESKLMELQGQTLESMQEGLGLQGGLPIVPSDRHRRALDRLQAFVALFEGYAQHAYDQVAEEVLEHRQRIDEVMSRRSASPSDGEEMLSAMLGLAFDRTLERAGETFCAAVVSLQGLQVLNRVWDAPDNLPSLAEIRDPFVWIERVVSE